MNPTLTSLAVRTLGWVLLLFTAPALAQRDGAGPQRQGPGGGPDQPEIELVAEFDADGDGRLNRAERDRARAFLAERGQGRRERRGNRGGGATGSPGLPLTPDDVEAHPEAGVFDPGHLRTIFLEFEADDWEQELEAFKPTDVEVPARMIVDGQQLEEVGVGFRGASSFFMVPAGLKRSLNLSLDFVHKGQRLQGFETLNLLNCNGDPSLLSSLLVSRIARRGMPAPEASFVRVVINGESWGVYCNVEQFNRDFVRKHFGTGDGTRWKVKGSPRGDGGLRYLGEDLAPYRERFEIKGKDDDAAWQALIRLCKALAETPVEQLEEALSPQLDVDGALWFLAVDLAVVNSDGYWTRASDYSLYLDPDGRFHVLPHDMNEALSVRRGRGGPGGLRRGQPDDAGGPGRPEGFRGSGGSVGPDGPGPGGPGSGPGGGPGTGPGAGAGGAQHGGIELDPLIGLDDESKPLRSRLLANPALRTRYLRYLKTIARDVMTWSELAAPIAAARELLQHEVERDTRKLSTHAAFLAATDPAPRADGEAELVSLRHFIDARSAFLLAHEALAGLPNEPLYPAARPVAAPTPNLPRERHAVRINEVMAGKNRQVVDPAEQYEDWIELYNTSRTPLDLHGLYLSDDPADPTKWAFPAGTLIGPRGYLIVWADDDEQKGLHANFKLSRKGERVTLSDGEHLLDELAFPAQEGAKSYGRTADGLGHLEPTPASANR